MLELMIVVLLMGFGGWVMWGAEKSPTSEVRVEPTGAGLGVNPHQPAAAKKSATPEPAPSLKPVEDLPASPSEHPARSTSLSTSFLLGDPAFNVAVSYAKAIALRTGKATLDPSLILLGIAKSPPKDQPAEVSTLLAEHSALIESLAASFGLSSDVDIDTTTSAKMSLDAELRELIKSSEDDSFSSFLEEVISSLESSEDQPPKRLEDLTEQSDFKAALSYAAAISNTDGLTEVSAEALLAGAVMAQRSGALTNRPSVSAHLRANADNIDELLTARGWRDTASITPSSNPGALPLSKDILEAVSEADNVSDPFMVALNVGLGRAAGLKLKRRIAYHEAGHAVVSLVLRPDVQITEVSLIEQDDSDGHVAYEGSSPYFRRPTSRRDFTMTMSVLLAGRGAEQAKFGHDAVDAGATSDLESAAKLAWQAITEWGLDQDFGPVHLPALASLHAAKTGWIWDLAQQRLQAVLKEAAGRTELILTENWPSVEAIAQALLSQGRLSQDEVMKLAPGITDAKSPAIH